MVRPRTLQDGARLTDGPGVGASSPSGPARALRHGVNPGMGCTPAMLALMSTQIAVRLPEDMVAFLDKAVADGRATSRAALVSAAVEREMRRQAAETDVEILRKGGAADDLDSLVNWTTGHLDIAD